MWTIIKYKHRPRDDMSTAATETEPKRTGFGTGTLIYLCIGIVTLERVFFRFSLQF